MSIVVIETGENNPILRKKSEKVSDIKSPEIQELILGMKETLKNVQGLGLAAPQVGKSLRIFVINHRNIKENQNNVEKNQNTTFLAIAKKMVFKVKELPEVYINPEITKLSKEKELMEEGCLSLPGIWGQILRHKKVEIEAQDEKGKKFKIKASGLLAQVFQHEMDHLEGILFIDKAQKIVKEKGLPENL